MRIRVELVMVVQLVAVLPAAGGDGWQTLVSEAGSYRVDMPGKAESTVRKVPSPSGPIVIHLAVVERNRTTFAVSWSAWPETSGKATEGRKRLDAARDGAVASAKGKLISEKAIQLGGNPGRELVIAGKRGHVRTRIFAAEKRLYQIMVVGTPSRTASQDADRFFGSFRLQGDGGK